MKRTTLANAIRRALDRGEFELHYQPIVSAGSRRVVGVEALARWIDSERGVVPAAEFIDVAEESGLIVRLGDWAIREACRQFQKWRSEGTAPERLAVNVSAAQFRRGAIVGTVRDALFEFEMEPSASSWR